MATTTTTRRDLALLLGEAARLLRERGWQGWGFEDQGMLCIDGALITAAGGVAEGLTCQIDDDGLELVKAASMCVVGANRLTVNGDPVAPDALWEWEFADGTTAADAIHAVEVAYALFLAGTHRPVVFANPLADPEEPRLHGRARRYRPGDHRVAVDCGRYGTVWAAPHQLRPREVTR